MSATASIKIYIDWVRDAHAMEEQAESMLTRMAERLEHYPVLQQGITRHIEETRQQQQLVRSVLDRLEESNSAHQGCSRQGGCHGTGYSRCLCQ